MNHAFPCGTLALDFLGTLRARRNPVPAEKLGTPGLLDDWFVESGMFDAAPHADEADLAAALELRESLYALVEDRLGGRAALAALSEAAASATGAALAAPAASGAAVVPADPAALAEAVAVLNRYAAQPPVIVQLEVGVAGSAGAGSAGVGSSGGLGAAVTRRSGTAAQGLAAVAREAVEILGGPDAALLRECGRPECTQVYLDRSRGHRREWCAMRTCGNRVKVSAYRSRHRTTSTPTSSAPSTTHA
ncbi:CGNR zinc finger domain-containing protein [Promicromonospora sp. NPDC059942]|uniref:CGNR zinc finger domain-containing protein n=1 Tax=Promicromonospora sp. NPDC059942 TaxID=3347009 RepID=UPI00365F58CE